MNTVSIQMCLICRYFGGGMTYLVLSIPVTALVHCKTSPFKNIICLISLFIWGIFYKYDHSFYIYLYYYYYYYYYYFIVFTLNCLL